MLRRYQNAQIAQQIANSGMSVEDFTLKEADPSITLAGRPEILALQSKKMQASFQVFSSDGSRFGVRYRPSESSLNATSSDGIGWDNVIQKIASWVSYVKQDLEADDPWTDLEDSKTFNDLDKKFEEAELPILDKSIDASMEHLVKQANENGKELTLEELSDEINELKKYARKETKRKWVDRFKGYILGKLADLGLEAAIASGIIEVFVETAKPVLQLVATNLQL